MKPSLRVLAFVASSMFSVAASAGTYVWTSIGYRTPDGEDSSYINREFLDITARAQLSWTRPPYSLYAASEAGLGFILADAAATSVTYGNLGHFMNNVFSDHVTLSRPDLAGQSGQLKMSFFYNDSFTVAANGTGQANTYVNWYAYGDNASVNVNTTYNAGIWAAQHSWRVTDDASGTRQEEVGLDEHYLTMTLNFVWGEPVWFGYGLASGGQAVDEGSYTVAHIGYFAGITEATAGGLVITDYTLSSRSGTDYSHATLPVPQVPEPATISLFAAGFAALGLRGAVRRRRFRAAA